MTQPRCVVPGVTYKITRCIQDRRFYLSPDDGDGREVNQIMEYCLAEAAEASEVELHDAIVMGNHVHFEVTDVKGKLPVFTQTLFEHSSKCLKELRGIDENVWSAEKGEYTVLATENATREAMAYTLANPTSAGLVRYSKQWPGVRSCPEDLRGHGRMVAPPKQYFKTAEPKMLRFTVPPMLRELEETQQTIDALADRVHELEQQAWRALEAEGRSFLGVNGVKKTNWRESPTRPRLSKDDPEHRCEKFKTLNGKKMEELKAKAREWRRIYCETLIAFQDGDRDVVWPAGTWHMRVHLHCPALWPFAFE